MNQKLNKFLSDWEGFEDLAKQEQVKFIAFLISRNLPDCAFSRTQVKQGFESVKLPIPNLSREFKKLSTGRKPTFLKVPAGYVLSKYAEKEIEDKLNGNKPKKKACKTLRSLLTSIEDTSQKHFLQEAIDCFEIGAYRASSIMVWLLTMDILYQWVLNNKLQEFNSAIDEHGKYKIIISRKQDFTEIKESDFIGLLRQKKIISNDLRKILDEKLGFRNTCSHPNNVVVPESKAISFIDDLFENVIKVFQ